jgi:hypothetical protein
MMVRPDATQLELRLMIVSEMLEKAIQELGVAMAEARAETDPPDPPPDHTDPGDR